METLVAMFVLTVGVFGTLMLIDKGNETTASTLKRDAANGLARELVERTDGLPYSMLMTAAAAQRLRTAADPDGSQQSAGSGTTWTIKRGSTTFRVAYSACTRTDPLNGIALLEPGECGYGDVPDPDPDNTVDVNGCRIGVIDPSEYTVDDISVSLKVLNAVSLNLCLDNQQLPLVGAVCQLLGRSAQLNALLTPLVGREGILNVLGGSLGVGVGVGLCGAPPGLDANAGVSVPDVRGASTRVTVTVGWDGGQTASGDPREYRIRQSTLVQRKPLGTGA